MQYGMVSLRSRQRPELRRREKQRDKSEAGQVTDVQKCGREELPCLLTEGWSDFPRSGQPLDIWFTEVAAQQAKHEFKIKEPKKRWSESNKERRPRLNEGKVSMGMNTPPACSHGRSQKRGKEREGEGEGEHRRSMQESGRKRRKGKGSEFVLLGRSHSPMGRDSPISDVHLEKSQKVRGLGCMRLQLQPRKHIITQLRSVTGGKRERERRLGINFALLFRVLQNVEREQASSASENPIFSSLARKDHFRQSPSPLSLHGPSASSYKVVTRPSLPTLLLSSASLCPNPSHFLRQHGRSRSPRGQDLRRPRPSFGQGRPSGASSHRRVVRQGLPRVDQQH